MVAQQLPGCYSVRTDTHNWAHVSLTLVQVMFGLHLTLITWDVAMLLLLSCIMLCLWTPVRLPATGLLAMLMQVELTCRVAVMLLRLHHAQLVSTPSARHTLVLLHKRLRPAVQKLKDTLGFNLAALRHLQRSAKEDAGINDADVLADARRQLGVAA